MEVVEVAEEEGIGGDEGEDIAFSAEVAVDVEGEEGEEVEVEVEVDGEEEEEEVVVVAISFLPSISFKSSSLAVKMTLLRSL